MKYTQVFILMICFVLALAAPQEDLVDSIPDYDYNASKMYSGYLQIEGSAGKNLHYLLVESQSNPATDPLVLWLNGGPGCSSLLGWIMELGPMLMAANSKTAVKNEYTWNKIANVVYLESPAGVGFSTADSEQDLISDDEISAADNLQALISFFKKFPEYEDRPFFIAGESYSGIYVPRLASLLIKNKIPYINLQGILVGNGVTDWSVDTEPAFTPFAYQHGIFSYETMRDYQQYCDPKNPSPIKCNIAKQEMERSMEGINIYDIYGNCPTSKSELGLRYTPWLQNKIPLKMKNYYPSNKHTMLEFLLSTEPLTEEPPCAGTKYIREFLNRADVKQALHVKEDLQWAECSDTLDYSINPEGSLYLYPELIAANLRILKFSGDTDGAVPFNGTRTWIHRMGLNVLKPWRSWKVSPDSDRVAGYVTVYSGLTFLTVRGAGHMVPEYKPSEAFHMFDKFLKNEDF